MAQWLQPGGLNDSCANVFGVTIFRIGPVPCHTFGLVTGVAEGDGLSWYSGAYGLTSVSTFLILGSEG